MSIENRYVVLDVETNGTSSLQDDLLSISIYKPDDGEIYNRFLPLELSAEVKTTNINGITKETLIGALPLTQDEVDSIIKKFELDSRIILTYGSIDEKFIKNYFKRKHIKGFELFEFYNFKRDIISSAFSGGIVSKDNLCNLFNIGNVQEVHSGENDCILEWKLFKRIYGKKLFVDNKNNNVYELNYDYIIPVSYLVNYPNFKYLAGNLPKIETKIESIKKFEFNLRNNKRFPSDISGKTMEHLINSMLGVTKVDSRDFLYKNKSQLKYIGNLVHKENMQFSYNDDGTITVLEEKHKALEREINSSNESLKKVITPVIEFVKENIFNGDSILSQELVVNSNSKVLSLCDLSTDKATMEIKTWVLKIDEIVNKNKYQLYYQSNGRMCYLMHIKKHGKTISFEIYKILFSVLKSKNKLESGKKNLQEKINNENIVVKKYVDSRTKVGLYCKICNNEWERNYDSIIKNPNCPFCKDSRTKIKQVEAKIKGDKSHQREIVFLEKLEKVSDGTISVKKYNGSKEKVDAECLKCGHKWEIRADHLLSRGYCPICRKQNN